MQLYDPSMMYEARRVELEIEQRIQSLRSQLPREAPEPYTLRYYAARLRHFREERTPSFVRRSGYGEMHPASFRRSEK
ncbi:hypothetical protein AYO38_00305 [bacterium SCGC AG-212-C10]|nr:hypothetical protein AYO38_00305 [bacterium SCGC AG-212-C10]